jgi:hypothetical protein
MLKMFKRRTAPGAPAIASSAVAIDPSPNGSAPASGTAKTGASA